jgi:O-methyltransferase
MEKNSFDVGGNIPKINDDRVSYKKGLFQETLPEFLEDYNNNLQLVIHNDSDLYSSTLYVLTVAHKIIVPGTIIIFDEFSSILNEFRALEDYTSSYLREYEVIAATVSSTGYYSQVAIKIV